MKSKAKVVVIGGGAVGVSALYHLAKKGWSDVVLVERKELTSGSSLHAAGNVHVISSDPNISRMMAYTIGLYKEIEQDTLIVAREFGLKGYEFQAIVWITIRNHWNNN